MQAPQTAGQRDRLLWPAGRVALNLLLLAGVTAMVAWVVARLQVVVVPVLLSFLIATILVPPADALRRRGVPSALATVLVMLLAAGVVAALFALVIPSLVSQFDDVGRYAQQGADDVVGWLVSGPLGIDRQDIDQAVGDAVQYAKDNAGQISGGLIAGVGLVAELVTGALLSIVIVFFFVHDGRALWDWTVRLFPSRHRDPIDAAGHRAWDSVSGYARGVAVIAVVDSVLIGLALAIIGVPLVIPLATLVFLGAFVPLVGATVSGAVAALVALITGGVVEASVVVAVIVVIQQLEGDLLYPVIVGRAVSLHGLAILLILTVGSLVAGLVGALLAVPVAAALWTAVKPLAGDREDPEAQRAS
jgi:putative heme transporter